MVGGLETGNSEMRLLRILIGLFPQQKIVKYCFVSTQQMRFDEVLEPC